MFQSVDVKYQSVDVLAAHSLVLIVAVVSSPVLVQLRLPIVTRLASVTYLLFVESAISAVVAESPHITSPLASYVIFVLVAPVMLAFFVTLSSNAVWVSVEIGFAKSEVLSTDHNQTCVLVTLCGFDILAICAVLAVHAVLALTAASKSSISEATIPSLT